MWKCDIICCCNIFRSTAEICVSDEISYLLVEILVKNNDDMISYCENGRRIIKGECESMHVQVGRENGTRACDGCIMHMGFHFFVTTTPLHYLVAFLTGCERIKCLREKKRNLGFEQAFHILLCHVWDNNYCIFFKEEWF